MSVDFFKDKCRTSSSKKEFGLCDDPAPANSPSYIDEENEDDWIGIVNNTNELSIDFYALDHCIELVRSDGEMENRCDGLVKNNRNLIFVELKSRKIKGSQWLTDGRNQLKNTIVAFKNNVEENSYESIKAYVCNKRKPFANQGHAIQIQKFKDETGYVLYAKQKIDL